MIRIRHLRTGQLIPLGSDYTVELTDGQERLAMVWIPNAEGTGVRVASADDDTHVLVNYAAQHNLQTSVVHRPILNTKS